MLQHYLKVALRNMFKYKGYTIINLAGLTMGLAICFVLFLWINDERSYDRFHENADRIYRSSWEARFGDNEWKTPWCPCLWRKP
ncbi:MAG: ABC transporter permease [Saprospiraceae bacterium]|nr:ABC transporter permease [Saprospiraceae bacterium]